jgi:DNA-binding transcriptional MerR regulator
MVSIGEFSRLSRLSPKALRLYDDLGLLVPDHVDAAIGYRWYAGTQLERARVVALLRRIRVPLAQIRDMLALDPASAAERIVDYWTATEMEHAAQRELVGYLVDRLHGKKPAMYEVAVRDIPARSLLSIMRRVHQDDTKPRPILSPCRSARFVLRKSRKCHPSSEATVSHIKRSLTPIAHGDRPRLSKGATRGCKDR